MPPNGTRGDASLKKLPIFFFVVGVGGFIAKAGLRGLGPRRRAYFRGSEKLMAVEWKRHVWPRIYAADFRVTLEVAPGGGRASGRAGDAPPPEETQRW
jgi:hypothetical protein